MNMTYALSPDVTLRFEQEIIEISCLNALDENWHATDSHGHEHYYDRKTKSYPTLVRVVDRWCYLDHGLFGGTDEAGHPAEAHDECRECRERVSPGMKGPGTESIPGLRSWTIERVERQGRNVIVHPPEVISEEEATRLIAEMQARRSPG